VSCMNLDLRSSTRTCSRPCRLALCPADLSGRCRPRPLWVGDGLNLSRSCCLLCWGCVCGRSGDGGRTPGGCGGRARAGHIVLGLARRAAARSLAGAAREGAVAGRHPCFCDGGGSHSTARGLWTQSRRGSGSAAGQGRPCSNWKDGAGDCA